MELADEEREKCGVAGGAGRRAIRTRISLTGKIDGDDSVLGSEAPLQMLEIPRAMTDRVQTDDDGSAAARVLVGDAYAIQHHRTERRLRPHG